MRPLAPMIALIVACGAAPRPPPTGDVTDPDEGPQDGPYSAAQLAKIVQLGDVALRPDGREVAFTSDRSGAFELWTVSIDASGAAGTPKQRTHAGEEVTGLVYAPDGSALAFVADHGGDERGDIWILPRDAAEPERLTETRDRAERAVRFSPDGKTIAFEADPDRPFLMSIHTMNLATRKVTRLTKDSVNVVAPRFSQDGRTIVATRTPDDQKGELVVVDLATKNVTTIPPARKGGIAYAEDFFPDGRLLAIALNDAGFMQLATVELASKKTTFVGPSEWDVETAKVALSGVVVYVRNVHGENEVSVAQGPELKRERILAARGVVDAVDLDAEGRTVVMAIESMHRPSEIVSSDPASGHARTIVAAELGKVRTERLAHGARREARGEGGRPIDAFVLQPPAMLLGKPPPAVVMVHGGPDAQARASFDATSQALAQAGLVVVAPNFRGSSGYGRAFLDANNHDWGGGDLKDILETVRTLGDDGTIDRERVGIMGQSFGGYMTLRALTAAPEAFRAGVDLYGMADLEEDYRIGESRFGAWYGTEMGDPAKDHALFEERSPIHFLDKMRAPLLVFQGENDTNVPRSEADTMIAALRARKHPVGYTVYKNEGHGFSHRDNRIDAMTRITTFFAKELAQR